MSAPKVLHLLGLKTFVLGPKEGLGLINGTAASAAVIYFRMHKSKKLVSLAQLLVAISCKALLGNTKSYYLFISLVYLHPRQAVCASNIL